MPLIYAYLELIYFLLNINFISFLFQVYSSMKNDKLKFTDLNDITDKLAAKKTERKIFSLCILVSVILKYKNET